jgi:MFS family permease
MASPSTPKIWTRDFSLIFLAHVVFSSAFCVLVPTLPIYLLNIGSTEVQIGVLIGSLGIASLVVRPFIGRALVRVSEKTFMMAGALLFALGAVGYLLAVSFWGLLMIRMIQGLGSAFLYTAAITGVANRCPESRLGQSLSYYYAAFNIAFALTPSFGMFLINNYGFTLLFLVCIGLTLCSLAIMTRLGRRSVHRPVDREMERAPLLSRKALPTAIMALISSMNWGALTAFFPLYALSCGVANPGLFFTAFAITNVSVRALGAKILDLYGRERLILPSLGTSILAMVFLLFSKTLPMFVAVGALWGIGHALLFPALAATTLERTGSSPGPAMATFSAFDELGTSLGAVISGILLRLSGYPAVFLCLVFAGLLNVTYFHFFVRRK